MIELPLKHKKEIIRLTNRYYELAKPRKVVVSLKALLPVRIVWQEENRVRLEDRSEYAYDIHDFIYSSKEIQNQNKKIDRFIEETVEFGKKYFNDQDWLWATVLWNFRPENNQKFDFRKVRWVKDYEYGSN